MNGAQATSPTVPFRCDRGWRRSESFFGSLIDKPVAQAKQANEVVICLSCESREEIDALIARAVAAGGRTPHPLEDHGSMYDQGFEDIDGHLWNLVRAAPEA